MKTTCSIKTSYHRNVALLVISLILLSPSLLLAQGPLTPPGAPAPTMKSLQQIEPRIDLQNAPAAAITTSNSNYHYILNHAGSYYLSSNVDVTKSNGILISVEGVTLDLNGFQVSRSSGTGGNGIEITPTSHRSTVHSGTVRGFAIGINSMDSAVGAVTARGGSFRNLAVAYCIQTGLVAGRGAVIDSCRVHDCHNGIIADRSSSLTSCTASDNSGNGIEVTYSSLSNCTAVDNSGDGIVARGGSTLTGCSADSNNGDGIHVGGCTVNGCTASYNRLNGVHASLGSTVVNSTCNFNGTLSPTASGIYLADQGCRAESNTVVSNGFGIAINSAGFAGGNIVIRNHAIDNKPGGNYSFPAMGNITGAIVTTSAALSGAANNTVNTSLALP